MGRRVIHAVSEDNELELVGAVDMAARDSSKGNDLELPPGVKVNPGPEGLEVNRPDVMIDFTVADSAVNNINWSLDHGINCVVGTTAIPEAEIEKIRERCGKGKVHVLIAPNFSIGAVLMMKFAEQAASFFDQCEIIELHRRKKIDSPSGTAITTAEMVGEKMGKERPAAPSKELISGSRGGKLGPVRIHSVRMDGLIAHQEVIFGSMGQVLTIRHDAMDRSCFMPGVILAVKRVDDLPGLTIGLEPILGL